MTQEIFDATISEIIILQEKPRRSKNFFKKQYEKRRLKNFFPTEMFWEIYKNTPHPANFLRCNGYRLLYLDNFLYCSKIGNSNLGIRYNLLNGRIKLIEYCTPRRWIKIERYMKKFKCRSARRFKGEISNGAEYKRLPLSMNY